MGYQLFNMVQFLGVRARYSWYWMPLQVTSHFYWVKDPLINTELYPKKTNNPSALLLSVPIILCKKPVMSQPFVNRLATWIEDELDMKNEELGKEYNIMILIIFIKQCCIYIHI